ncbi:hypothetical protein LIG30_1217 [Burkholderia sp. lig30]|jgi:hypothetical protein|uniref:hypothetical protein n=1 Tax=Burkholderia sp. lig30 TaxID=1192124 RepID=UPI0004619993|nr:hypothetical protein [Burkholderia sp. lig30]KDB10015.1 hypothetical protein LIG30_1217 [Burkholderia sp. lig30]
MRELNSTEHAAVSGGLSTSDVKDWISNLLRPKPAEPYVNPFPSAGAEEGALETIGKIIVVAAVTTLAALFRAGSKPSA